MGRTFWEDDKGSATVFNNVIGGFKKRFSNSSFVGCVDKDVGIFEAWVSVPARK